MILSFHFRIVKDVLRQTEARLLKRLIKKMFISFDSQNLISFSIETIKCSYDIFKVDFQLNLARNLFKTDFRAFSIEVFTFACFSIMALKIDVSNWNGTLNFQPFILVSSHMSHSVFDQGWKVNSINSDLNLTFFHLKTDYSSQIKVGLHLTPINCNSD